MYDYKTSRAEAIHRADVRNYTEHEKRGRLKHKQYNIIIIIIRESSAAVLRVGWVSDGGG